MDAPGLDSLVFHLTCSFTRAWPSSLARAATSVCPLTTAERERIMNIKLVIRAKTIFIGFLYPLRGEQQCTLVTHRVPDASSLTKRRGWDPARASYLPQPPPHSRVALPA